MSETKIYRAEIVQQIIDYYGGSLHFRSFPNIREHLSHLAEKLHSGIQNGNEFLYTEINNYHPLLLGESINDLKEQKLDIVDCQWTIAAEYGFKSWEDILDLRDTQYNSFFEQAVDSLLAGDFLTLQDMIKEYPSLLTLRSQYGHKASLLHYTASNGVEIWRQQVPSNLVEVTAFLLHSGMSKSALMNVYGSQFDTLTLLKTSAHPYHAGLGDELVMIFE